jgi:hypothetical protein
MKILASIALACGTIVCCAQTAPSNQPKRLFIEERTKTVSTGNMHCDTYGNCYTSSGTRTRDVSLELTREIVKRCPQIITVTDNHDAADFDLRISGGNSTLFNKAGDVAYMSPAKWRVSNLAKDVCAYVAEQR